MEQKKEIKEILVHYNEDFCSEADIIFSDGEKITIDWSDLAERAKYLSQVKTETILSDNRAEFDLCQTVKVDKPFLNEIQDITEKAQDKIKIKRIKTNLRLIKNAIKIAAKSGKTSLNFTISESDVVFSEDIRNQVCDLGVSCEIKNIEADLHEPLSMDEDSTFLEIKWNKK